MKANPRAWFSALFLLLVAAPLAAQTPQVAGAQPAPGAPPNAAQTASPGAAPATANSRPSAAQTAAPGPEQAASGAPSGTTPATAPSAEQTTQPAQAARAPQSHARPPANESAPAPDLPAGTIEVLVLRASGAPIAGQEVRLGIMFQRISEGESRSERLARTDAEGRVRFEGLQGGSNYSYRVTLKSGPAEYASMPFGLGGSGHRVKLHVFPVTRNIKEALVGMRGFLYIEPRDDIFQFQVLYRVFNIGAVTWVPDDVVMELPAEFKAFSAERGMTDIRFEQVEGKGARLVGTFPPGQHDVGFRFQLPKERVETAFFGVGLLPHVAEMRVIAEASTNMTLDVEGFEPTRSDTNPRGQRVLVTRKLMGVEGEPLQRIAVTLSGLPVPGPGRWIAALIAALLAGSGGAAAAGWLRFDAPGRDRRGEELVQARELLLQELVELESARRAGELGPRAHADAKKQLLDALVRLGPEALAPSRETRA